MTPEEAHRVLTLLEILNESPLPAGPDQVINRISTMIATGNDVVAHFESIGDFHQAGRLGAMVRGLQQMMVNLAEPKGRA